MMRFAPALPMLVAALWPLGAYTGIPYTPISTRFLAAAALLAFALHAWRVRRMQRPPFEYWWVAVAALCLLPGGAGAPSLWCPVFFLAPVILLHERRAAQGALLALSVSGGAAALLHAAAQAGWQPPAGIHAEASLAIAGTPDVAASVLMVFHAALAGVFVACVPTLATAWRILAAVAALISVCWLLVMHTPVLALARPGAAWSEAAGSPRGALLLLLALWLAARVAARSLLRAGDTDMPPRGVASALVLAGAVAAVFLGALPDPVSFLALGLIAAHDAPWARGGAFTAPRGLLAAAIACAVIQVLGIAPPGRQDPRNQAARAEELLQAAAWETLDARLDFLLARYPGDPAYSVLRARSLAAQGWFEAAAATFAASARPAEARGPINLDAHVQALIDTLRDQASRLPHGQRGLFFERALVHAGEADNAVRFLALDSREAEGDLAPAADLARAIAVLIGDPALAPQLEAAGAPALLGYCAAAGLPVRRLPEGFPESAAPLILRASAWPDGVTLEVWGGPDAAILAERRIPLRAGASGGAGGLDWDRWVERRPGGWMIELDTPLLALAEIVVETSGEVTIDPVSGAHPGAVPARPALFIP
ncbi:MAG: hypothetical protein KF886_19270 [Candidatus Hydrogenedentes bacterium]|nr:hypothetical protein [Candidatus Hydrogenedentota bacterium]